MYSFDSPYMIIAGILTGLVFGFFLQKAAVTRYQIILGQFLFKDFTVLKVMLTAIVVGSIGIWVMLSLGWVALDLKPAVLGPNIVGGLIFGIGMAIFGFCPGTGIAALGDGARHAWPGLLGMILGGALFAETYPLFMDSFMKAGTINIQIADTATSKVTLADLSHLPHWLYVIGLAVVAVVVFAIIERFAPKRTETPADPVA